MIIFELIEYYTIVINPLDHHSNLFLYISLGILAVIWSISLFEKSIKVNSLMEK